MDTSSEQPPSDPPDRPMPLAGNDGPLALPADVARSDSFNRLVETARDYPRGALSPNTRLV